ncbi:MAG: endonuclease III [Candidatus Aenigmatarchaeota archaeon]|nr:endonuclease III [Candidatus Aenigmarchaeota archaeon]
MSERARRIIRFLEQRYGPIAHRYRGNPFRVLISCVLSQRTREENTEVASKALFAIAGTPQKISKLPLARLQKLIKASGTYRQKARHIRAISKIILEKYGGKVPRTRAELLTLPGVGWKTSAIVMSYGFGKPIIAVDTHVNRISKRLGIADEKDDVETVRKKLQAFFPRNKWLIINLAMISFGRDICLPRNPRCTICQLLSICPFGKKIVLNRQKTDSKAVAARARIRSDFVT